MKALQLVGSRRTAAIHHLSGSLVDLLYNLLVLWSDAGVSPAEIGVATERRE
jgi:phosphoribosyl-ATP pyrophosphohydrolase